MPQTAVRRRSGQDTRQRILEAAIKRFSRHSYEETGLRDIAVDVGIDVALVHRSFGSKEQLFAEAVKAAFQIEDVFAAGSDKLPGALARRVLEPSLDRVLKSINPLDIIVRSLSSPQAIPILRESIFKDFIIPLSAKLTGPALERAAVVAACLMGISLFRSVLLFEPLRDQSTIDLEPLITGILDLAMTDVRPTRRTLKPRRSLKTSTPSPSRRLRTRSHSYEDRP